MFIGNTHSYPQTFVQSRYAKGIVLQVVSCRRITSNGKLFCFVSEGQGHLILPSFTSRLYVEFRKVNNLLYYAVFRPVNCYLFYTTNR